jgi:hypothetical protein
MEDGIVSSVVLYSEAYFGCRVTIWIVEFRSSHLRHGDYLALFFANPANYHSKSRYILLLYILE